MLMIYVLKLNVWMYYVSENIYRLIIYLYMRESQWPFMSLPLTVWVHLMFYACQMNLSEYTVRIQ